MSLLPVYGFYLAGWLYASYMVFSINPDGNVFYFAPLFGRVRQLGDVDFFKRRLYAIESWIILSNLIDLLYTTEHKCICNCKYGID